MNGFFLHRSNHLERLVTQLGRSLGAHRPADPITPATVVVGSRGMERWLRHRLASESGLCCNVEFLFPTQLVSRLVEGLLGEPAPGPDPWSSEVLVWSILDRLPALLARPEFAAVQRYLAGGGPRAGAAAAGELDRRALTLAQELADLFDHYVHYRRDWVERWAQHGQPPELEGNETASWQAALWRDLAARPDAPPHFAARAALLEAKLDAQAPLPLTLESAHIFGVSSLPPPFVELLGRLSERLRLELYLFCPSDLFWGDLRTRAQHRRELRYARKEEAVRELQEAQQRQNPLLTALGRISRDMQLVLESPCHYQEDGEDLFVDPTATQSGLLQQLQSDVRLLRSPGEAQPAGEARVLSATDDTLQLHSCHGPTRQVEVLRDALLGLFADHPQLQPRDVVVMTPDIATFAPLIETVFSRGPEHPGDGGWGPVGPRIPFQIADLGLRRLNPVADVLLRVLELVDGRSAASAVIDLVSCEPVRRRFELDESELARLRDWVGGTGIRWGVDAEERGRFDQPELHENTWLFGLERLALGVVMPDEGRLVGGVLPYDDMEGSGTELFGRVAALCATLFQRLRTLRTPRPMAEWCALLRQTLDELVALPAAAGWLREEVLDQLTELQEQAAAGTLTTPLTLDALRQALTGRFEVPLRGADRRITGDVTVCALTPMRSVPFPVVCLLGIDDGVFPRSPGHLGFDLMQQLPRLGDRDARDEDRQLFLEALLSAREHLLICFTGRNLHTNERRPLAVPVAELLEVVEASFVPPEGMSRVRELVLVEHPLQPFSEGCFAATRPAAEASGPGRPFSFDQEMLAAACALRAPRTEPSALFDQDELLPPPETDEIQLDELVKFLCHPARQLLKRRLKLSLQEHEQSLADREPIELGGLDVRGQGETLLAQVLRRGVAPPAGDPFWEEALAVARARGELPLGTAGRVAFWGIQQTVQQVLLAGGPQLFEPRDTVAIDVGVDLPQARLRLVGAVPGVDGQGVLTDIGIDKPDNAKRQLSAWVRLLALQLQRPELPHEARLIGPAEEATCVRLLAPARPAEPLRDLLALYLEGLRGPLPFFPKSAGTLVRKLGPDPQEPTPKQLREALREARVTWEGNERVHGEGQDGYYQALFPGGPPFEGEAEVARFVALARQTWGPLLAALAQPAEDAPDGAWQPEQTRGEDAR